jgi:O-antigen/teichoic acid export membrane protein
LNPFKRLLTDTAIYGISSIVGRFLNWFLVPYHTRVFGPEIYGIVSNLYSYVAFALIILTYGMETGFFRFASRSKEPEKVYSTSVISLFSTALIFLIIVWVFRGDIASAMQYPDHSEFIWWLALTVSLDAVTAIPFAQLRLKKRPLKFAFIKLWNIGLNIGFNLFFLSLCPLILKNHPDSFIRYIYNPEIKVGYVFIANLLASVSTLILLYREILFIRFAFDKKLLFKMLDYSFPILLVGLAGMVNQNIDKILIPFLIPTDQNPMFQLGIYGANYKLAVLMNMFIQAFRYAFEPFFFSRSSAENKEDPMMYATVMKYFIIFGLIIFLGMMLYIDIFKYLIEAQYHIGLKVVPLILMGNLFFGVFFSVSMWYKLKDKTWYGVYISLIGAVITLIINILLIPVIGYMGSAIAAFVCFFVMMIINYLWGQKFYPIPYDLKRIGTYFLIGVIFYGVSLISSHFNPYIKYSVNTLLMIGFFYAVLMFEKSELLIILKKNKG